MNVPRPIFPKEHGAWALLLVPMITAAWTAGAATLDLLLFVLGSISVFLAYLPVQNILRGHFVHDPHKVYQARFWAGLYLVVGLMFLVPLLFRRFFFIILFGVISVVAFLGNYFLTRRYGKTSSVDLLSVIGITVTGPSSYYIITGLLDLTALLIWLINILFFGFSVFYVRMKISAVASKKLGLSFGEKLQLGKQTLLYLILVSMAAPLLSIGGSTPLVRLFWFLPISIHSLWGTLTLSSDVKFKNLGFLLLGQSVLFSILLGVVR